MAVAQQSKFARIINSFEETMIAVLLGLMTLITFANVVARYVFNTNILWAVEGTVYLFAWLVLLGVSYGIKHSIHIGVDVLVKVFPPKIQKFITLIAVAACVVYAGLLLVGAWQYWAPFIGKRAFLETEDIPIADMMQFLADWFNEGERYEKLPRFLPYFVLPLSMALILWRFLEAGWKIISEQNDLIIASHEAEELMEEAGLTTGGASKEGGAKS